MHVFFCVSKNVSVSCAYTQGKREQFSGFNRTLDAINNVFRKFSAFHDETGRLNVDGMNIISNDGSNKLNRSRKDRKSGLAGMPRPISYAVCCMQKKTGLGKLRATGRGAQTDCFAAGKAAAQGQTTVDAGAAAVCAGGHAAAADSYALSLHDALPICH